MHAPTVGVWVWVNTQHDTGWACAEDIHATCAACSKAAAVRPAQCTARAQHRSLCTSILPMGTWVSLTKHRLPLASLDLSPAVAGWLCYQYQGLPLTTCCLLFGCRLLLPLLAHARIVCCACQVSKSQADTGSNHAISALKFGIIKKFLLLGWAVLLSDIDVCVLQDPFKFLYRQVAGGYRLAWELGRQPAVQQVLIDGHQGCCMCLW